MKQKLIFLKTFTKVRWLEKWTSRSAIEAHQKKAWAKQKSYFLKQSPYFREHGMPQDFQMDKAFMMAHFDRLNTQGIKKDLARRVALESEQSRDFQPKLGEISVGLSSGTSGNQGIFLTSPKEQAIWAGTIMAKLLPRGRLFGHKLAFFLRSDNNLYQSVNSPFLKLQYYDMELPVKEHLPQLNAYQPNLLVAPASVLRQLASFKRSGELTIGPTKVISVAEILEDSDRDMIAQAFGVPTIHQVYQATEGFLGATCQYGTLHLNEDGLIIEKEWLDDKRFYPIITDFKRQSQPFVRYHLNDILQVKSESCPCGSKLLAIEKIEGRSDDIFYGQGQDGSIKLVYPDFIRRCFLSLPVVDRYQVSQVELGTLRIGVDQREQEGLIVEAFQHLCQQFGMKNYNLVFVPYQEPQKEKLRRIKQEMPKEKIGDYDEKVNY